MSMSPNDEIIDNGVIALETQPPIEWGELKPIPDALKAVQPFNFNLLPDSLRMWIQDISERMQCPPDYPAIGAMVTLSAVIGRSVGIKPKAYDDWLVVGNLWGFAVGRPSAMKTPALSEALKPLKRLEIEERERHEEKLKEFEIDKEMMKLTGEKISKYAKNAVNKGDNAKARELLAMAAEEETPAPKRKRYIVYDATIEKLGELLNENPNGLLLFRDEISGWLKTLDREDKANDKEFWIESFGGLGSYTYDRIGRGTIDIQATTTSVLGGIQPAKLQPYIMNNMAGGSYDDGFIQRLQLAVYPEQNGRWKYIDRYPNKDAKDEAFNVYDAIANKIEFPEPEDEEIPYIRFSEDAQSLFIEWLTELEIELREGSLHPVMESHLTKYRSLIPSLALIIHIAELAAEQKNTIEPVSKKSLIKAIQWGEYLRTHAERIYGIGLNSERTAARLILDKIEQGKLSNGFTARDIKQSGWSGLTDNDTVKDALQLLEDFNYIVGIKTTGANRQTFKYSINPEFIKKT